MVYLASAASTGFICKKPISVAADANILAGIDTLTSRSSQVRVSVTCSSPEN